ncbi:oligosaccharide flippase family protein [soil metagenome]
MHSYSWFIHCIRVGFRSYIRSRFVLRIITILSQIRKLAGQTAIYGLSSIVGRLLNYLLVPIYTRIFTPGEYGVVSEYYAYVTFLMILFTYGMETAYFHFSTNADEEGKEKIYGNCLSLLSISSAILSGLLILFSSSIASALGYANHPEYIIWFSLILAFDALTALPFARLRQLGKAKKFAGLKMFNIVVNISLNIFFLYFLPTLAKHGGWIASFYNPAIGVGYVFLANLIASALTLVFLIPDFKAVKIPLNIKLIRQMLLYAFPILIAGFAGMINETLDRAILKHLIIDKTVAIEQLGIYSACYKLSILMTLFVQTFRYAAEPFYFSQQHKDNARELFARIMNYFVLICSIIFLAVMLYIDVVKHFIGEKFYAGLTVVPILLMANLFLGVYLNLSMWYKLTGQTRFGAWLSIFGATITIAFLFWLIPPYGYVGAAWATFICYGSMMVASYIKGQQIYPVPYHLSRLLLFVGVAVGIWLLSLFLVQYFHLSGISMWIMNTLLLLGYIGTMWKIERGQGSINILWKKS